MGTVIDEAAAKQFEQRVDEAIASGAKLLTGNQRVGALYPPTVLDQVTPTCRGQARNFRAGVAGDPLRHDDQAIALSNSTAYGLSSAVAPIGSTTSRASSRVAGERSTCAKSRDTGWNAAFRGNQGFGFGIKEGVLEAMRASPTPDVFPPLVAVDANVIKPAGRIALLVWGTHIVRPAYARRWHEFAAGVTA